MNFSKLSNDELQELLAARTQHARSIDALNSILSGEYGKVVK